MALHDRITALAQAIGADIKVLQAGSGPSGLTVLTADTSYYVSPTGNDTNNGLSAITPFKSIGRAITVLRTTVFFAGYRATINLAAGTYPENVVIAHAPGPIVIQGPSSAVIAPATGAAVRMSFSDVSLKGVTIGGGGCDYGVWVETGGLVTADSVVVAASGIFHYIAIKGGVLRIVGTSTIAGKTVYHIGVYDNGVVHYSPTTVTFTAAHTMSIFAQAGRGGIFNAGDAPSISFVGAPATGCKKYDQYISGGLWLGGKVLPGSVAGTATPGTAG